MKGAGGIAVACLAGLTAACGTEDEWRGEESAAGEAAEMAPSAADTATSSGAEDIEGEEPSASCAPEEVAATATALRPAVPRLHECVQACKSGAAAMQAFCRSIPDPRVRAGCWGVVFAGEVACINWCHWHF